MNLLGRLESEQRHLEEQTIRQNAAKMSSIDKNNQVSFKASKKYSF